MTLLVFGRTGQVATELAAIGTDRDMVFLDRQMADLNNPTLCAQVVHTHKPRAVINAAAWTAVDRAEVEEAQATIVNGDAPAAIAVACKELDVPLVHISTDYVFDGTGTTPFNPEHPTQPLGAYGRSKQKGEQGVRAAGGVHAILRTSWVFSAHGNNFLKTMLRLGRQRESLNVIVDQIGGPTPARAIAQACLTIAEQLIEQPNKTGTYHFAGVPEVSWADFARSIMMQAGLGCQVVDIPSTAYPTQARRPANSRMDCSALATFGLSRPDWQAAIVEVLSELEVGP